MADGDGNNGAASTETGTTTVVESVQGAMMPKKPKKRKKKSKSSDEQSTGDRKKDRLVWTPKLHGKFVRACKELGVKDAVPMKILRRMKVSGVTRAQVASHLQKYRANLSKQKDKKTSDDRGDATTTMVVRHGTHLDAASSSASTTALLPAISASVPPSPRSPLETTPNTMCQPPNGPISSDHDVTAANLYHQPLQLLLLPPVQHQQCFPPPLLLHQVGAVTITGEQTPSMMQQQAAAVGPASQHDPTLVGVEQAACAENGPPVSMLQAFPVANMMRVLEEPETSMVQALVDVGGEKGPRREEAAVAGYLSPHGSIIERHWGSGDRSSWDLFGLRRINTDAVVTNNVRYEEAAEIRMEHLQMAAKGEEGQGRAAERGAAEEMAAKAGEWQVQAAEPRTAAAAGSSSPHGNSVHEQYWKIDDITDVSWDFCGIPWRKTD